MSRQHQQADARREAETPLELESQFVLRLPEDPAKILRELLQNGANLKDRVVIRLENDMRYGEVRVDHWLMHAKIVDMPTVVESLKTIDNKSFYKTADICQMMICKEEPDQPNPEEENANKNKKKDPFKVEKKFLWPHGVTPPCKNVRKRRFRKTLKKKYVEAPEIEKEVKRLLRIDNDAVNVRWEVLSEEEDQSKGDTNSGNNEQTEITVKKEKASKVKQESKTKKEPAIKKQPSTSESQNVDVERHIFGGAVSDSDEEIESNLNVELNDNSRMSEYDSRMSDSNSMQGGQLVNVKTNLPTEFASDMFHHSKWENQSNKSHIVTDEFHNQNQNDIHLQLEHLSLELESLRSQRIKKEQEIATMENLALRQRFQEILNNLIQKIVYKEAEYQDLQALLHQSK